MDIEEKLKLYDLVQLNKKKIAERKATIEIRARALHSNGFVKTAFDSRKTDQETQINPRRGLQNYNRSSAFISQALSTKLKNLISLKDVLGNLKEEYGKERAWQDSNARVLLSNLEIGLRTKVKPGGDGDFSETQNGVGSLNYLEELLYTRYRLPLDGLSAMGVDDLKKVILDKDEELVKRDVVSTDEAIHITKKDIGEMSYESLIATLFAGVKATQENKKVKRKITIEIEDSIDDPKE